MQNILHPYCAAEKNLTLHLDQPKPRHLKKSVMMATEYGWVNFLPFNTQ